MTVLVKSMRSTGVCFDAYITLFSGTLYIYRKQDIYTARVTRFMYHLPPCDRLTCYMQGEVIFLWKGNGTSYT